MEDLEGSLQILLDFKVDDQLYSDHHPLVLTIKGQNFNEKKTKREDYNITRYRWSADGLAMFKMKLEELREKNIPASDDLVYTFNQRILEAMSSAKITYSIKGGPRKSKPWFDKDCYDMKKLAKESLKKYRKTNRLEDRECYASSRKKYLALLDLKRKGFDNEKQEILRNAKDSKTFWKTIALYKSTSIIQGEISIQDWLNFYRELMTTEKNLRICNLHNVISQNDPILDSEITNADIYKEIAGLRSNKACGPDGIPNEVLKTLPDSYILLLKQLYNSVMTTGKYPAIWTNSTIHPIFKNGYKNSPSNYRDLPSVNLPEFGDIHLLLYADDIAIIGESRINLQKKIKILKEYLDENLMTLNESKSKIMVFRNGDKPPVERLLSYVPRTFVNCLNSEFIQKTFGRNECGRRHFQVGDKVLFTRVIQNRRKWFKAQVIRRLGYNVYLVKNLKGTFKVHVNQMRTGSDTKYAEDSDWTLDNAGAGPHRLEQDPQISTSPPPRRSTRPRCPPCRFSPTMNNIRKEE
ncbi:hypothetical protein LAZ67_12002716 [Cordylochernes scorpioides]|uniref:Reverse transcriptase domain-containing protein n=1 Tax=Cordylochernes scorpioides TaxID=51811 RepID=A0ABY6L6V5_9ARAC|nr:hypothetical protein LAZ67_12002716 [Cordylochernes scorpioides]